MDKENFAAHQDARFEKLIEPTIPAEFVFDALRAAPLRGVMPEHLLEKARVDHALLKAPGSRVSVVDYARLIRVIIQELDDGFLGFADATIPKRAFAVFAAHIVASHNLRELFDQFNYFFALFSKQFVLELAEGEGSSEIRLHFDQTQDIDYRFIQQSILLVVLRLGSWMLGTTLRPQRVDFSFDERGLAQYFDYLFDCPLRFDQPHNAIYLDSDVLDVACSCTLQQVNLMLRDSSRLMLLSDRKAPFTRRVRESLLTREPGIWPSIQEVSQQFGMSENLLWRKLKQEGTNYVEIRDALKRDLALSLIADHDMRIGDIAERLGFTEVSSFNKAFHRWTSSTPSHYRKQLQ